MKATRLAIPDVILFEPRVFGDDRGFFFESYNQRAFEEACGHPVSFVQDNHSRSARGVLRGLHYQIRQAQENWCAPPSARYSTWPSTCVAARRPSATG